jgi:hypothetical protein
MKPCKERLFDKNRGCETTELRDEVGQDGTSLADVKAFQCSTWLHRAFVLTVSNIDQPVGKGQNPTLERVTKHREPHTRSPSDATPHAVLGPAN